MSLPRILSIRLIFGGFLAGTICIFGYQSLKYRDQRVVQKKELNRKATVENIAAALKASTLTAGFPTSLNVKIDGDETLVYPEYTIHTKLQDEMLSLFKSYRPDYGAFVAMDAKTGRVLSLISYNLNDTAITDHLALRATFPSASVFKVVTAAAAIAEKKLHPDSIVSFSGRAHTLYKSAIFKERANRWTRTMTLKEAFAKSVNTVFGKIGVFNLGPSELKNYADKFGFNRPVRSDLPFEPGKSFATEDPWEVAETASGFTKQNRMSPLQGALIAASIVNDGIMMSPYVVDRLKDADGKVVHLGLPEPSETVIDPATAAQMRELMRETVASGTSRVSFRGFSKSRFSFVDVGGKTGSLTGDEPKGKYDWFVGYAQAGEDRIAFATLTISREFWKVKSAYLTRRAIETLFRERYGLNKPNLTLTAQDHP
ncbi:MAG: penicillin-binding protein [Proteobacteria bacterium]|nr:MAG: penicillin-binding protein [Pseudomonadota bacterium]